MCHHEAKRVHRSCTLLALVDLCKALPEDFSRSRACAGSPCADQSGDCCIIQDITEGVFRLSEIDLVTGVVLPIILVFLVAAVSSYISRYALAWVAERLVMDLRVEMFKRLLSLSCATLDRHTAGSLVSRFTFDAAQLKEAATNVITTLGRDTLSIIGLVAWMAYIDWLLTLIALLAGPVILSVLLALRRRLRRLSRRVQDSMADLHHVLNESIAAHRIIKIFAGQAQEGEKFSKTANANRSMNMKFVAASAAGTPAINLITALALGAIVYAAAAHAQAGSISVAEFNSFFCSPADAAESLAAAGAHQ